MRALFLFLILPFCAYADDCDRDGPPKTAEEHASAYQCRQKIRETANEMRMVVEQLVRENVPGIFKKIQMLRQFYPYIDVLERNGIDCCQQRRRWECCTEPLVEQLEVWNTWGLNQE